MGFKFDHFNYKENLNKQRVLFKDCFPETDGDSIQKVDHYLWKFKSFEVMPSWEYICKDGDELVGYYAALAYKYKIGEEITDIGMVCDVMTSPQYRGKGIFTKLGSYSTQELSQHVPFTMGYPIRKEVIPGHLKVGWEVAFELPLYIKFLKVNSLLNQYKLGILAPIANLLIYIYNWVFSEKINYYYNIQSYSNINEVADFDTFTSQWQETVDHCLVKDKAFYNWRFNAPNRDYEFIAVKHHSNLVAFLTVRKVIKYGVQSICIIDYMVLPEHEKCHGLINSYLKKLAKKENAQVIMTMMSKASAKKYKLFNNGFLKSPFKFSLIIKILNNMFSKQELFDENKWHLMWVDSDDL